MACVFKIRITPPFNHAGNLKGVAAFKKQTELYCFELVSDQNSLGNLRIYFCTFAL